MVLNSMHKYMACVTLVRLGNDGAPEQQAEQQFVFPVTTFIAVTGYHSEEVTQMKITHNPFAKGFRHSM